MKVTNALTPILRLQQIVGSCEGDSGGPAFTNAEPGQERLVGLVSFGSGDCSKGLPSIYTDVYKHKSWIERCANVSECNTISLVLNKSGLVVCFSSYDLRAEVWNH